MRSDAHQTPPVVITPAHFDWDVLASSRAYTFELVSIPVQSPSTR